jgi:hypothetical protein
MRIADCVGHGLCWRQPAMMERRYVLQSTQGEVATLSFRSVWGTLATGDCAEGSWTFKRVGFLSGRVTIRRTGAEADLAVFRPATWSDGGEVALAGGRVLRVTTGFWQSWVAISGEDGAELVRFAVGGLLRLELTVEVAPAAGLMPELPWLLMLGCYLVVKMHDEAAATSGAVVACCG